MSSILGNKLKISVFGQSHGKAIGVCIDGLPSGERVDMQELRRFMQRRRPGANKLSTARQEADEVIVLSGIADGVTCASPLCAIIENSDAHSSDYAELADKPRPSHADYTAYAKWHGNADMRGGGHFSGRLTAPLCIAGGIAKQILERQGIYVGAHLLSVGSVTDEQFPLIPDKALFDAVAQKELPVIDDGKGLQIAELIKQTASQADSVGGVIECAVVGLPAGLGEPMFDGMESRLAAAIFGVPAVKGIEFGAGFACSKMNGSECNDPFCVDGNGHVATVTNNSGGIQGGITNGMPLTLKAAIKPTPSIGKQQQTVSLSRKTQSQLTIKGRHDPCIAHRAVPVIEAVAAAVILDIIIEEGYYNGHK